MSDKRLQIHPTLQRQLRRAGLDFQNVPDNLQEWDAFLNLINQAYSESDNAFYRLERSLEISSREMKVLYERQQKLADGLLAKERDKLRAVIAALGEGLAVLSADGLITYLNPEGAAILRVQNDAIIGDDFFEIINIDSQHVKNQLSVAGLQVLAIEGVLHFSNRSMQVLCTVSPILEYNSELIGLVVVFRDVTDGKLLEQSIKEARDSAIEASNLKSEFLATMSHEIRTPLNGIVSLVELLLVSNLDEQQLLDAKTIQSCARSLQGIINNVLDFSKIEAGKLLYEPINFNLREQIENFVTQMQAQINEKNLDFKVYIDPEVPEEIVLDPLRFTQVLVNLVSNAIKFTPDGGAISVAISNINNSSKLKIVVTDSGIGIKEEKIGLIFESFTQADGSISRNYGGTGLGLAICSNLVKRMGGEIWAESKEGQGSNFIFTVEASGVSLLNDPVVCGVDTENKEREIRDRDLHQFKILLVEDNRVNQDTISRMLKIKGYQTEIAENGVEGVETLKRGNFDLVLMDLHMPVMGGIEATKIIRADLDQEGKIPIVALTAHALSSVKEECLQAGMDDYISKPIDYDKLFSLIERYANRIGTGVNKSL